MTAGEKPTLVDRFRGALVGTAVGDALGAPTEGHAHVPTSYLDSLESEPPNLTYTDDTAMTLGVAQSLVESGRFDGAQMAETLATNYGREPWRGYGAGPPQVFAKLARGVSWDEAARTLFGGDGSYGNGAAMRVAPVALYSYPSQHGTAETARLTAIITHSHPEGIDGAVVQAVAITTLLASTSPIDPAELTSVLLSHITSSVFRNKLIFVERNIGSRSLDEMADVLGTGIAAHSSVVTALACFLANADSFSDAVKAAIGLGGDTDTIGAMTGALGGAYLGLGAIPEPWRAVEGADELISLADALYETHEHR